MRILLKIFILFGLVIFLYSFVGDAHLELHWIDAVQNIEHNQKVLTKESSLGIDNMRPLQNSFERMI